MFEAAGMKSYAQILQNVRLNSNQVGPTHHLLNPQPTTSRLGFKGKRPTKATMKYIVLLCGLKDLRLKRQESWLRKPNKQTKSWNVSLN